MRPLMLLFVATCMYSQDVMSRQADGSYIGAHGAVSRNGVLQTPGVDYVRLQRRVTPLYPWSDTDLVTVTEVNYAHVKGVHGESVLKYQFTLKPSNVTSGSIASSGSRKLTLKPCPLGIAGENKNHYVRISGGTGDAETVLLGLQITDVTNTYPAVVTTAFAHGLTSGQTVTPFGFTGNWTLFEVARAVTVLSPTTYSVDFDSTGLGAVAGTPRIPYGTCTSGASSGTVAMTTVNSHTGAWTITSATAGLQEAFYGRTPTSLFMPDGAWQMYAPIYLYGKGGNTVMINGDGPIATRLFRDPSMPAGNMITWDGAFSAGNFILRDITLVNGGAFNNTSGSGIYLNQSNSDLVYLNNVFVYNGFNPITITGSASINTRIENSTFFILPSYGYATSHVMQIDISQLYVINCSILNSQQSTAGMAAVKLITSDGIIFQNNAISGYWGVLIDNDPSKIFNFLYVLGNIIDSCYQYGITFSSKPHNTVYDRVSIVANHIVQSNGAGSASSVGVSVPNDIRALILTDNQIEGWVNSGVVLGASGKAVRGSVISNNVISNNNVGNAGGYGIVVAPDSAFSGTTISGNTINNSSAAFLPSNQQVGIYFAGSSTAFNGYTVTGNTLSGNTVAPIFADSTVTFSNMIVDGNLGQSDQHSTVSSSTTVNVGFSSNVNLTGTTSIATILPSWSGRRIQFNKTDAGSIAISGGGNIASPSISLTQYGTVDCTFNGPMAAWMCR